MSLKFFSILVLIFFIGCSTPPIKYDKPVKVADYKHFVRLKEEKDKPVSKKTFTQKVKDTFTRKPKVEDINPQSSKTKKPRPEIPTRRVRKTNTDPVTNVPPVLMANTRPELLKAERDVGKTIMLYLIYIQAIIITIFAYIILRRRKEPKKITTHPTTLNL